MLHRPARTVVSVLGIGVGILLIVFTVGLANGSLRDRAKREANVGAEIMVRASGSLGMSGSEALRIPVTLAADIEKTEGVAAAVAIGQNTISVSDAQTGTRLIDGVDFDRYADIAGMVIVRGRKFEDNTDEVICDTAWAQQNKLSVGQQLPMFERNFTLVGIFEPGAGARTKIPLSTLQKQLGAEGKASAILVKIKPGFDQESVAENIHSRFPDNQVMLTRDLEELYMSGFPALNVFLNVVIGVAGAISALIILLTMYTTVTERTRQIGVLKSLGMSNTQIAWTIVQEALLISLLGIVFGLVATFILSIGLDKWTTLNVKIEPSVVFSIFIVGIISAIIGALYPGLRAARLDPVDALGYE